MRWIKKYWDTETGILVHNSHMKYNIPSYRFTEGVDDVNNRTWLEHLAEKSWIDEQDLRELAEIFRHQHPNINWDLYLNYALKIKEQNGST